MAGRRGVPRPEQPPLTDYDVTRIDEHPMPDVASPPVPKVVTKPSKPKAPGPKAPGQGLKRATARVKPKAQPAATAPIPYVSPFSIGDHISHPQFGEGTVTGIDDAKLTIDFANRGTKQIIDYYVKRSKAE
jgi:Protein of unknown function (DUF3553)